MQPRMLVTRIYKTEPDGLTNEVFVKTSKSIIDLDCVVDYEEYVGDLKDFKGFKSKPMMLVTSEFGTTSDTKVILFDFDIFHKIREDYIRYVQSSEGIVKLN